MSPTRPSGPDEPERMSLIGHLAELRRRLIASIIVLMLVTFVCFAFSEELFLWLRQPLLRLPGQKMIVLGPLELFITYIKLAALAAVFVSSPWLLLQTWLFISPGLYAHEKRWVVPFVLLGSLCFVAGGAFAFYVVMPMGFDYLVKMVPEAIEPQYSVAIYFSLVIRLLLAFGIVFELPLLMWILAAAGIVAPKTFASIRKYWIVIATVLGAVLTPPDPLTQLLMAVPLVVFFEVGILGARALYRKKAARPVRETTSESASGAGL